jgi:methyl-accepting chemotaxis protein
MKNIPPMNTITRHLLRQLSLFAVLLLFISGTLIALIAYRMEMKNFEQRFDDIQQGYVDVVGMALWEEDRETIQMALDSIRRLPGIQSAHIHSKGKVPYKSGRREGFAAGVDRYYPLTHVYNGKIQTLGDLHVQGRSVFLRGRIIRAILFATAIQAATIFFIFLIYLLLIYRNVVKRVLKITEYTSLLSQETLDVPLVTEQNATPDELGNLADTINRMREDLHRSIEHRKVVEEEIRRHRDELEGVVAQRTLALKVANEKLQQEIDEKNRINEERERLIASLQAEISKVKKLSGLLPICASCKKIRDDDGYWNEVESYIRDRSEAEFSHGICPECARRLYPDIELSK